MCVHPIVTTLKDISLYFLTKRICCWSGFYAERLYSAKQIGNSINSEKDKNEKRKVERLGSRRSSVLQLYRILAYFYAKLNYTSWLALYCYL